jgi:hypothetical protein
MWDCLSQTDADRLERLQNKANKIICNNILTVDTKLISLKDRRSMHLSIFTFKCINNLAPIPFNEYFTLHQPKRSIRNSEMKLLVPRSKLEFAERSVLVRGSKTFNNLPEHVRLESSLPSFKAKLLDLFTA